MDQFGQPDQCVIGMLHTHFNDGEGELISTAFTLVLFHFLDHIDVYNVQLWMEYELVLNSVLPT